MMRMSMNRMARSRLVLLIALGVVGLGSGFYVVAQNSADSSAAADAGDDNNDRGTPGDVIAVTAYRGQAMVTRDVPVPAGEGLIDVVVTDLPDAVQPGSLFADGGDGVEVRAVRYRPTVERQDNRGRVQEIVLELELLGMDMRENESLMGLAQAQLAYMARLEQFATTNASAGVAQGQLDVQALRDLTEFVFAQRAALVTQQRELAEARLEMTQTQNDLQSELRMLGGNRATVRREAVIFLEKTANAASNLRLSYLVGNVNWRPSYNMRAESGGDAIRAEYSALVQQMSGEDWTGVELTLSTASPALLAQGTSLDPLFVGLAGRGGQRPAAAASREALETELRMLRASQNSQARSGSYADADTATRFQNFEPNSPNGGGGPSYAEENARLRTNLNALADRLQTLEFANDASAFEAAAGDEGISVEYRLAGTTSLASRSDQQIVRIADVNLDTSFVFTGTPVLSEYVYLQGTARNTSDVVLLEGPYTAYLDGRFVGRAAISMVGIGESFDIGFGIDSQLRVQRVLTERTSQTQGGNEVTTFRYRLTVTNYKDEPVNLRLYDRRPVPQQADIQLSVNTPEAYPLSSDELYVRDRMPNGILRWDLEVPGGASGVDALTINYEVVMEYDRSQQVVPR